MLIAIDIGTTNIKAVAVGDEGTVWAEAERQNDTLSPQPGWQEQDSDAVFQYVVEVLAEVWAASKEKEQLLGVIFSSAMHGLMAVDEQMKPLTNIMLWSDMRADSIAGKLRKEKEGMQLYHKTGVPIHAMSPLCKIIWLRENEPDVFQKTHQFLDIKAFIWYRLTGACASDFSVASASGLLNTEQCEWDEMALECAGITASQLPKPVSPAHSAMLTSALAKKYELPAEVPCLIGASDGALANLGSHATEEGEIAVTIGTSAAIRTVTQKPMLDGAMRTFCYRLDETRFIVGGASNNGTNALEWLRQDVFQSEKSVADFAAQAKNAPPAAEGLLFLPYLLGERAPLYNAAVLGSFQGISARHRQEHFVRAVMEGILFNVKVIGEALEAHVPIQTLHAGGGFSHNTLWVQMLADIFQKTVVLPDESIDASLLGAIYLAREILKLDTTKNTKPTKRINPNKDHAEVYATLYQQFKELVSKM